MTRLLEVLNCLFLMRLMSHKSYLVSTFLVFVISINLLSQEVSETSKYENFKKSNYSLEELGYNKCDRNIFGHRPQYKKAYTSLAVDLEVTPENFKNFLMNQMCTNVMMSDNFHYYYKNLDFDTAVISFLQKYSSEMQHCDNASIRDKCFGAGLYHAGLYLGEWNNNFPNGKGIALITNDFPYTGYNLPKARNKEAIYTGDFKNGYPHGYGFYDDGYHTYEGNWVNGERHGEIGWIIPSINAYGFSYVRDSETEFIKIHSILDGSSANINEVQIDDIIYAFQVVGKKVISSSKSTSILKFSEILEESDEIILFLNSKEKKVLLKKNTMDFLPKNSFDCTAHPLKEHGCFEKAINVNKYTDVNTIWEYVRGSFFMGRKHMFHPNDFHAYSYKGENPGGRINRFCQDSSGPMLESNLDTRNNPVPLHGNPNIFVPPNFYQSPCGIGTVLLYPELILENEILLERAWTELDANSEYKGIKIDFIYALQKAVKEKYNLKLFDPAREIAISNPNIGSSKVFSFTGAHRLCLLSKTISDRACYYSRFTKPARRFLKHVRHKTVLNPQTEAHKNMQKIKLERAKFNVAAIKLCKQEEIQRRQEAEERYLNQNGKPKEYIYDDPAIYITACLAGKLRWSHDYWLCKYYGYDDSNCISSASNYRFAYSSINNYIKENPKEFEDINYNEWVFGKELEL